MRVKGLTIFRKIFLTCFFTALVAIFISDFVHYRLRKKFIEDNVRSQGKQFLGSAADYFDKVYDKAVSQDLKIISASQPLDGLLTSRHNELLMTRPAVEKLFLHFTKYYPDKYLSLRFIDRRGKELVITRGHMRDREYRSVFEPPENERQGQLAGLFSRLKESPANTVLFSDQFIQGEEYSLWAGINKSDPDISGFAGAVVFEISLKGYYDFISSIKINNYPIIEIHSIEGEKLFGPLLKNQDGPSRQKQDYFVSAKNIQAGSRNHTLFLIKAVIPARVYAQEIRQIFWGTVLLAMVMMLIIFITTYLFSRKLSGSIQYLLEGTKKIAGGDLSTQIDVTSDDEIGLLTENFNSMVLNLKHFNERLTYEACHDVLTDLPNRTLLLDRLDRLIKHYKRDQNNIFALLFIDLNRFKYVNDSLGHQTGDLLLKEISKRFNKVIRSVDTIGRLGGDEFVILMDKINSAKDPQILAERLRKGLDKPFNLGGQEIYVSCSIGIILSQPGYDQPADYLRDADTAMYHAKSSNASHYKLFDESMRSTVMSTMQMEMDLRAALEQNQFVLHYQPIVCLKARKIVRFEALIRWMHPLRGSVSPLDFIQNAEETGLVVEIDRWVMRQVCKDIREWNERKLPKVRFSINFSARQFEQKGLIKQMKEVLSENKVTPDRLGIEITESVAMNDLSLSIAVLNELHQMGINISIDDFGMGYSSLNSLKLFPVDHLKIDRHFIADIPRDRGRGAIIEAIIVMSHKLGYKVVGEGVESKKQLDFLCRNKCDEVQGYLFSKPLDFNKLEDLMLQPKFNTDFSRKD